MKPPNALRYRFAEGLVKLIPILIIGDSVTR